MHLAVYNSLLFTSGRLGQRAIDMYTLIEDLGGDAEQLWYEHKIANLKNEFQVVSQYQTIQAMKAIDHILQFYGDGWFVICHLMKYVFVPTTTTTNRLLLQTGLSPNTETLYFDEDHNYPRPLLYGAIYMAAYRTRLGHGEEISCIISLLVEHGANVHYIFPDQLDTASSWRDLSTLWKLALRAEFETGWLNALQDAGVDVDEYRWEDIRRRKQAIRLRGATRSGVDERVLELPSISGLRCRPCHRKHCRKHYLCGILEDREWDTCERETHERKAI
jgi:hypothetical protein